MTVSAPAAPQLTVLPEVEASNVPPRVSAPVKLKFRVPVAPLVKLPAPESAVVTVNVPLLVKVLAAPASEARNLWFYFFAPALTTVGTEQSITVTCRATAS